VNNHIKYKESTAKNHIGNIYIINNKSTIINKITYNIIIVQFRIMYNYNYIYN